MVKLLKLGVNFYKVIVGVCFSLVWARVMYIIWDQPSYITFIWFYIVIGSILLKWVFFVIIDRINMKMKLKAVRRELDQSTMRVHEASIVKQSPDNQPVDAAQIKDIDVEERLKWLEQSVLYLGNMVAAAVEHSVEGLKNRDHELARQIIENDEELDLKEFEIRDECMRLLSTCNLDTDNIRMIIAVLGIAAELERMGDYAEGIANISLMIGDRPLLKPLVDIPRMAQKGIEMLKGSLQSFSDRDVDKAKNICRMDDEIDALSNQVFRELLLLMIENPNTITQATRLLWVAHNLERFADRITNICEQAAFSITGEMVDISALKY